MFLWRKAEVVFALCDLGKFTGKVGQYVSDNDLCIDHLQRTEAEDIVEEIKIMLLISTMNVGRKKHIRPSPRYIDIIIDPKLAQNNGEKPS